MNEQPGVLVYHARLELSAPERRRLMSCANPHSLKSFACRLLAAVAVAAGALPVNAEPAAPEVSPWRFSGYGTLARSWDSRDDLALIRDISQRPKHDFAGGPSWRLDSRLGLQLAYRFSPQMEAVGQIVARYQDSTEFHHYVDLGYLDIQVAPALRLRLGRIGYDAFLMSDHRNLGYAYAWVRPPVEYYGWIPIFSVDGTDLTHEFQQGDARWRLRAQAGKNDFVAPMGESKFNFHADGLWSLSAQREEGPWRLKASLSGFTSTKDVETLGDYHAGLRQIAGLGIPGISAEAATLDDQSTFKDVRISYAALGASYDDGRWFGQAELGSVRTTKTFVPQTHSGYAVLGRRFGTLSPFIMLGVSRPARKLLKPINDWSGLGAPAVALQTLAYQQIVNSTRFDQETFSMGARWDIDARAALKLQLDHTRIHPNGYAAWFRDRALLNRHANVNLLTLSMDFVF